MTGFGPLRGSDPAVIDRTDDKEVSIMNHEPLGVAVIGAGMAGRAHANAFRQAGTVFSRLPRPLRLRAIADANLELAEKAAADYGFERAYGSWEEVVADPEIHAVSVVVGNSLHRPVSEALLAAGKHVLCEKPLAATVEDAEAMVAAANAAPGLVASINYSYRRTPAFAEVQRRVRGGDLGQVTHFDGHYLCDYGADTRGPWTWRDAGPMGSGCLGDLGSHLIDLAEQLFGPITSVDGARLSTRITERRLPLGQTIGHEHGELSDEVRPVSNDDDAVFVATFASGVTGSFNVSRVAYGHDNSLGFTVHGLDGVIGFEFDQPAQYTVDVRGDRSGKGRKTVIAGPQFPYYREGLAWNAGGLSYGYSDIFVFQVRGFLDEVLQVLEPLPRCGTFADGLHTMRVIEAVVEADRSGRAITVDDATFH